MFLINDVLLLTNELKENTFNDGDEKIDIYQHLPLDEWYYQIKNENKSLSDFIVLRNYPEGDGIPMLEMHKINEVRCKYGTFHDLYIKKIDNGEYALFAKKLKINDTTSEGKEIIESIENGMTFNISFTYNPLDYELLENKITNNNIKILKLKKIQPIEVSIVNVANYAKAGFNIQNIKNSLEIIGGNLVINRNNNNDLLLPNEITNDKFIYNTIYNFKNQKNMQTKDEGRNLKALENEILMLKNQLSKIMKNEDPEMGDEENCYNSGKEKDGKSIENSDHEEEKEEKKMKNGKNVKNESKYSHNIENSENEEERKEEDEEEEDEKMKNGKNVKNSSEESEEEKTKIENLKNQIKALENKLSRTNDMVKNSFTSEKTMRQMIESIISESKKEDKSKKKEISEGLENDRLLKNYFNNKINNRSTGELSRKDSKSIFNSLLSKVVEGEYKAAIQSLSTDFDTPFEKMSANKKTNLINTITTGLLPAIYPYLKEIKEAKGPVVQDVFKVFMASEGEINATKSYRIPPVTFYNANNDPIPVDKAMIAGAEVTLSPFIDTTADFLAEGETPQSVERVVTVKTFKPVYKLGTSLIKTIEADALDVYGIIPAIMNYIVSAIQRQKNRALIRCLYPVSEQETNIGSVWSTQFMSHIYYQGERGENSVGYNYSRPLFLTAGQTAVGQPYAGKWVNDFINVDPTIPNFLAYYYNIVRSRAYEFLDDQTPVESMFAGKKCRVILPTILKPKFATYIYFQNQAKYYKANHIDSPQIAREGMFLNGLENAEVYKDMLELTEAVELYFVDFVELLGKDAYKGNQTWFMIMEQEEYPAICYDKISNPQLQFSTHSLEGTGVDRKYYFYDYFSFSFKNPYAIARFQATAPFDTLNPETRVSPFQI